MWTVPQVLVRVSGCWLGCFQHQCITFPKGNAGNAKVMPCLLQRVHLLIYALSAFDDAILGFNKTSKWVETSVYFTWGSVLVCIVFVVVNFFMHFSSWNEEHWGSTDEVYVKYSWEAVASLFYASIVLWL
jgi:hypothetical protein